MTTPIERAAEALAVWYEDTDEEDQPQSRFYTTRARAALEAALDRSDLINVLEDADLDSPYKDSIVEYHELADAIITHLLAEGGES